MIDRITNFIVEQSPYKDKKLVKKYVEQHLKYNTLDYLLDNGEIIAVVRWNIKNDKANILDLYIRKDFRGKGLIRLLLKRNLQVFPYIKWLRFVREVKYPNRKERIYNVLEFLKGD